MRALGYILISEFLLFLAENVFLSRQIQMAAQMWNNDKLFEFQSHRYDLCPEFGEIVLVCMADFSDETMNMEPLDRAGDLGAGFPWKLDPQVFVLKAADGEFPALGSSIAEMNSRYLRLAARRSWERAGRE